MTRKPLTESLPRAPEIFGACHCLAVQRAARTLARRYDEALRPLGITSHQFSILSALLQDQPAPLTALAQWLGLDRTTLTRNLAPLEAQGLIETCADARDRRVRGLTLTTAGRQRLGEALPLWRGAQAATEAGGGDWEALQPLLHRVT